MWEADGAGSIQARKYFNEERETTFVEVKRYYDQKVISNVAGVLFPDIVTPISD